MKKVLSFEFGDPEEESGTYSRHRWTVILNGRKVLVGVAVFVLFSAFVVCLWPRSSQDSVAYKRAFIQDMTRDAWALYTSNPANLVYQEEDYNLDFNHNFQLIKALSTLLVMNLTTEFEQSKNWILHVPKWKHFSAINRTLSTHQTVNQYLGSLLSVYALTNDTRFLEEAVLAGSILKQVYSTNDFSGVHLEWRYLADLTDDEDIRIALGKIEKKIEESKIDYGLPTGSIFTDIFRSYNVKSSQTFAESSNGFYFTLIKQYWQSNGQDVESLQVYSETMDSAEKLGLISKADNGLTIIKLDRVIDGKVPEKSEAKMTEQECILGGLFALGAKALEDRLTRKSGNVSTEARTRITKHWGWAKGITETCHSIANRTSTGLFPFEVKIDADGSIRKFDKTWSFNPDNGKELEDDSHAFIKPELAETYFYLWRLTQDPKYRDYAWELAQNIYKVRPAHNDNTFPIDYLGSVLKYLYLTFTDEDVLSLDRWVFNRVGQPLPICGKNAMYPMDRCKTVQMNF